MISPFSVDTRTHRFVALMLCLGLRGWWQSSIWSLASWTLYAYRRKFVTMFAMGRQGELPKENSDAASAWVRFEYGGQTHFNPRIFKWDGWMKGTRYNPDVIIIIFESLATVYVLIIAIHWLDPTWCIRLYYYHGRYMCHKVLSSPNPKLGGIKNDSGFMQNKTIIPSIRPWPIYWGEVQGPITVNTRQGRRWLHSLPAGEVVVGRLRGDTLSSRLHHTAPALPEWVPSFYIRPKDRQRILSIEKHELSRIGTSWKSSWLEYP